MKIIILLLCLFSVSYSQVQKKIQVKDLSPAVKRLMAGGETNAAEISDSLSQSIIVAASNATVGDKYLAKYICDGTNDEVQIAAAEAALPNGGKIRLTAGLFTIDANFLFTTNYTHLDGAGINATKILIQYEASSSTGFGFDSTYGCSMSNLTYEANDYTDSYGLLLQEVTDFTLSNCFFGNIDRHQVRVAGSNNIKVIGCTFKDLTYDGATDHGLDFDISHDGGEGNESVFVIGNWFGNGGGDPLKFENVKNGIVANNEWYGVFALIDDASLTTPCENVLVTDNLIHRSAQSNVGFNLSGLDRGTVKFRNNILDSCRITILTGISTGNDNFTSTVEITDNTIQNWPAAMSSSPIEISGDGNIIIDRNILDNISTSSDHVIHIASHDTGYLKIRKNEISGGKRGIWLQDVTSQGTKVSENNISGGVSHGIYLADSKFIDLYKNHINGQAGASVDGIYIVDSDTISVSYNESFNNGDNGIEIDSMSHLILAHNQCISNTGDGIILKDSVNVIWEWGNIAIGNGGTDLNYTAGTVIGNLEIQQDTVLFGNLKGTNSASFSMISPGDIFYILDSDNSDPNDYWRIMNHDGTVTYIEVNESGNVGFGKNVWGDNATFTLMMNQGTAPTTSKVNGAQLWVENGNGGGTDTFFILTEDLHKGGIIHDTDQEIAALGTDTTFADFSGYAPIFHPTLGDTVWILYKLNP